MAHFDFSLGKMGVGEMGVGKMVPNRLCNSVKLVIYHQ